METNRSLSTLEGGGCGCCHLSSDGGTSYSCADRSRIFTPRELEVLQRIREYSGRARDVKREIENLGGSYESLTLKKTALDELERLRAERSLLETERIAAAEERMRLLGHL